MKDVHAGRACPYIVRGADGAPRGIERDGIKECVCVRWK